jgi:anti-sigma factor RsiW
MRCQDIERLILETRELTPAERAAVEAHLAQCAKCAGLADFWRNLHGHLAQAGGPGLPEDLEAGVRLAGHAAVRSLYEDQAVPDRPERREPVPSFIWLAFTAIVLLTLALFIPGLQGLAENQKMTLGAALALILVLQNALTLLFAPVVLRRQRHL